MDFFSFQLQSATESALTPEQQEIKMIVCSIRSCQPVQFDEKWVTQLLRLFGNKEEISLFWTLFSRAYFDPHLDLSNPFLASLSQSTNGQLLPQDHPLTLLQSDVHSVPNDPPNTNTNRGDSNGEFSEETKKEG
jgi:hypothetical protein